MLVRLTRSTILHSYITAINKVSCSQEEFFKGYGINRNAAREDAVEEAVKWYLLSAKQGVADAQFNLSIIYELEFGDDVTGRKWAELASKNGHIKAQWNVSGSVDCNKAKTDTEKAICRTAEVEFSDSMQIEGEWSMKKLPAKFAHAAVFDCDKATTEKAKVICISAHEGDVDAQFEFGKLFASGGIIVLDNKQAAFWFLKAAEQGHPKAQWAMGAFYGYGMGGGAKLRKGNLLVYKSCRAGRRSGKERLRFDVL